MDLRRIRHFNVLAETLNFSRAAERLHIAQPALSVSIQKLETELGTRLFERTSTGVSLTPSGQSALVEARRLLYHGEQLLRSARDAATGTGGRLRIGFVGSAIFGLMPNLISSYRRQYPDVELVLRESTSSRIVQALTEESLDIGIVRTPLLQLHAVSLLTLQRDAFILAVPPGHALAGRERVDLASLQAEDFVLYSASDAAGLHGAAMAVCQSAGFLPRIAQQANQISTVLALVETGLGIALVPQVMRGWREPQIAYLELQAVAPAAETTLALAWVADGGSPAAERFIDLAGMGR